MCQCAQLKANLDRLFALLTYYLFLLLIVYCLLSIAYCLFVLLYITNSHIAYCLFYIINHRNLSMQFTYQLCNK